MDKRKIEHFVRFSDGSNVQSDSLSMAFYYSVIFSLISLFYGVMLGKIYLIISLLMIFFTISYIVLAMILKRRLTPSLQNGFLCSSILSLFSLVFFFLFGLMFFIMQQPTFLQYFILVASYPLIFVVYWVFFMITVQRSEYIKKERKQNKAAVAATIGGILGISFARVFLSEVEQNTLLIIVSTGCFFISLLFSLGLGNLLKYYYSKKYNIEEVYPVSRAEKKSKKKMGRGRKTLIIFALLFVFLLTAFFVIGLLTE